MLFWLRTSNNLTIMFLLNVPIGHKKKRESPYMLLVPLFEALECPSL